MSGSSSGTGPGRGPEPRLSGTEREGRKALLKAARELLAEVGVPEVTERSVAERAGVGPALVTRCFGDRDGLLQAVIREVAGEALSAVRWVADRDGDIGDRLRAVIRQILVMFQSEPYMPRLILDQVLFAEGRVEPFARDVVAPNFANVMAVISAGIDSGDFRRVDPRFMMPSLAGACIFFPLAAPVLKEMFGLQAADADFARSYADHVADVVLDGIRLRDPK